MRLLCDKMVSQKLSTGDDEIIDISIIHNWLLCNECLAFSDTNFSSVSL